MFSRIDRAVSITVMSFGLLAMGLCTRASDEGTPSRHPGDALRVLIISGRGHPDGDTTTPFLRRILAGSRRFTVRDCEVPSGLTSRMLADFDVLVYDAALPAQGSEEEKAVTTFVEEGNGLVVTHAALGGCEGTNSSKGTAEPVQPDLRGKAGAVYPVATTGALHSPVHFLDVRLVHPDHPILQGIPGPYRTADAVSIAREIHPDAEIVASTNNEKSRKGDVVEAPLLVTLNRGKGRIVSIALGHDRAAMQEKQFVAIFARATEWAATGHVTLPANVGLPRAQARAVKALVITGGHEHETSFYSLFDGYEDLARMPVSSSTMAFQGDLRGKYDVLIMYDFSRDLDETGKKNLRNFVESGKGIVVLHHALLSYQQWPWWYEEVVGGSYRLKTEGNVRSSTVKDAQQIFVTPEGEHPITAGIGPFHIEDEAYKRMWFSPRIRPLLSTDNPYCDPFLAWIGPCTSSRVVAIQLGHGPSAFGHPSYRALVHNAILWSAGRLK